MRRTRKKLRRARARDYGSARPDIATAFPEFCAAAPWLSEAERRAPLRTTTAAELRSLFSLFESAQEQAQLESIERLCEVSQGAFVGLLRLKRSADPRELFWLDFLQFWLAVHPMQLGMGRRMLQHTYDWILQSLSDRVALPVQETIFEVGRVAAFARLAGDPLGEGCVSSTIEAWTVAFFYYSRVAGVLRELGHGLLPGIVPWLIRRLPDEGAVEALVHVLSWTDANAHPAMPAIAAALQRVLAGDASSRQARKNIAIALTCAAPHLEGANRATLATRTLAELADVLEPSERLQMLVARIGVDVETIRGAAAELDDAIVACEASLRASTEHLPPTALMYARGRFFDILLPLVAPLLEAGECALLQRILTHWRGGASGNPRTTPSLILSISHPSGALYALEGRPAMHGEGTVDQLAVLIKTAGEFLGVPLVLTGDREFVASPPPRGVGVPDRTLGVELDRQLTAWLDRERLRGLLEAASTPPEALIVVPGSPLPIQSLVHRDAGRVLPLAVSMQQPARDRPIRHALLWVTGAIHADAERAAVLELLEGAGVQVTVVPEEGMSKASFAAHYESPIFDLIWFSSHGEYDHYSLHRYVLLLHGETFISLDELLALRPPAGDRRLLVLNACDGGTAATLGGPGDLGVAPALCGSAQAVVSHVWPADTLIATVFGVLLAVGLIERRSFLEGHAYAQRILLAGKEATVAELTRERGAACAVLQRLIQRDDALSSLSDWGSAVFLE